MRTRHALPRLSRQSGWPRDGHPLAHHTRLEAGAVRADCDFVAKHKLTEGAEDILVNTDSFIEGARSLDPFSNAGCSTRIAHAHERLHQLEQRLVMAAWAYHKLGYTSNKAIWKVCTRSRRLRWKGQFVLVQAIAARDQSASWRERFGELRHEHPGTPELFNKHRKERLTLRYFQHLSLLIGSCFLTVDSITRRRCGRS